MFRRALAWKAAAPRRTPAMLFWFLRARRALVRARVQPVRLGAVNVRLASVLDTAVHVAEAIVSLLVGGFCRQVANAPVTGDVVCL
jgi:aminoglycoside phosphotransferase family enzyme